MDDDGRQVGETGAVVEGCCTTVDGNIPIPSSPWCHLQPSQTRVGVDRDTRPFPIATKRGDDTQRKWLTLDPLVSCAKLFDAELDMQHTLNDGEAKRAIREPLRWYMGETHLEQDIARYVLHVDGVGPRHSRRFGYLNAS